MTDNNNHAPAPPCPALSDALTVIAGFEADDARLEVMQALVSQWSPPESFAGFAGYDAGQTDGHNSTGYFGAVFDGRYVYFSPEMHGDQTTHGIVLRCDTQADFKNPDTWEAFDAAHTAGLETKGFYGAACNGRYVYFIPRQVGVEQYHSRLLRYDTQGDFKDAAAWDAHDIGEAHSQQSAGFDGRYLYFCPGFSGDPRTEADQCGRVIRADTHGDFHSDASYTSVDISDFLGDEARCFDGGAFDGRYVYFVPLYNGMMVRYDTQGAFDAAENWEKFDANPLGYQLSVGAVFDGTYIYYCPYGYARVIRFDTRKPFADAASWETYDADVTDGIRTDGFDGGFFDGKYVWFQPFFLHVGPGKRDNLFHSHYLRYDVTKPFGESGSWQGFDASATDGLKTVGYNAGAFDGRYFYAAPWQQGPNPQREGECITHGNVLRVDTLGDGNGAFSLRYCDYGHNGGLNAAAPGATFMVNTEDGRVLTISAHTPPPAGRHQMAGVYDGREIKLYIDGECVASREAHGRIAQSDKPIAVGNIDGGGATFCGRIEDVTVRNIAHTPSEIMAIADEYLHRVVSGLALKIELDTYFVLDARSHLGGCILIAADDDVKAAYGDRPMVAQVCVRAVDGGGEVWSAELKVDPRNDARVDFAIPVDQLGGEFTVTLDAPVKALSNTRHDRREVAFVRKQMRSTNATHAAGPDRYVNFVKQVVTDLREHQSFEVEGTVFLTVTAAIHRGYRSIGHKVNDKYVTFWFPEVPYERQTFRTDTDLWPMLENLSRVTGDTTYAQMVDAMAETIAPHSFDRASGLPYFSEEADLDLRTMLPCPRQNAALPKFKPRNTCDYPAAPLAWLWNKAPQQTERAMRSIFYGLITDPDCMGFNRFCFYGWSDHDNRHSLSPNASHCAFDTAASRMIACWCDAYARTGDATFLDWANRMTTKWAEVQHEESGLMPNFFGCGAWDPHLPQQPGQWTETRGASLTAATLIEASQTLKPCDNPEAHALQHQLHDMGLRLAQGVARFAYDPDRHIYREHLALDGSPYSGTARYTFSTQAEKDEAVRNDPQMQQVAVYDGAGFYNTPTYFEHVTGSNVPWLLSQVMINCKDTSLATALRKQVQDGIDEATKLKAPITEAGYFTFRATARLVGVLVNIYKTTGDRNCITHAGHLADRELDALEQIQSPQWWRMPERTSFLEALLALSECASES